MRPFIISGIAEVHSELELKLRKINIPPNRYNNIAQHPEFLNVFDVLKKRFGYNSVDMENLNGAGGPVGQVDRILELSNIKNSCEILEALAISGYKLHTEWKELYHVPCVLEGDVRVIKNIGLSLEAYLRTLEKIKKSLGIRNASYIHSHASNILSLVSLKDEHWTGVDALCKCGYINFSDNRLFDEFYLIEKVAKSDVRSFLDVFEVLKKRFGYKSVDMENLRGAGGSNGQVERILELSSLEGVVEVIDALAESGYELCTEWKGMHHVPCVLEGDMRVVKGIIDLGLDNYLRTLKRIKECSGKRNINYNCNLNILTLTNLEEKYWTGVEALCKCDYINFSGNKLFEDISLIKKIANSDTKKFLDVFNALKKRFGYNSVDMGNLNGAGGPIGQVNRILELSDIENSCDVLEALAKSGYKLNTEWRGLSHVPSLQKEGMDAIKKLAKGNLHKKEYSQLITKLEKELGYKNIKKDYVQLLNIAEFFSKFRSSICEKTIDILAEKDYQSIKRRVTKEDVAEMEKLAYNLWNKELDNLKLENICLYKENAQGFIELFSNLKEQEQKIVLKAIINCNYENKEITDWLDKNYLSLIREVGLSP